ncbi:hypothetical protein [Cyclobacterium xiamenense]|uniref:hypothetical protein n=1 Tax=Cyclobacterium xiamenense TaxID=1297121 RepID=UPI0035D00D67
MIPILNVLPILIIVFLVGDRNPLTIENENMPHTTTKGVDTSMAEDGGCIQKIENQRSVNGNLLQIRFEEFIIGIDRSTIGYQEETLKQPQKDTASLHLAFGETIEGQKLGVHMIKKGKISIYQRFENSVTVMDEGPHCDLTEWKHYYSRWKKLKIEDGFFLTDRYSVKDGEKFVKVDMNELREAVGDQCGDDWAEHINDVKSPKDYPLGVSTSRIFLKAVFTEQDTGEEKTRIISFKIPMGC